MDLKRGKRGERGIVEDRLMKRKIELREREERRKNTILKGNGGEEWQQKGSHGRG